LEMIDLCVMCDEELRAACHAASARLDGARNAPRAARFRTRSIGKATESTYRHNDVPFSQFPRKVTSRSSLETDVAATRNYSAIRDPSRHRVSLLSVSDNESRIYYQRLSIEGSHSED